jgi:hypothetical protein
MVYSMFAALSKEKPGDMDRYNRPDRMDLIAIMTDDAKIRFDNLGKSRNPLFSEMYA